MKLSILGTRWFVAKLEVKIEPQDMWVGCFWDWREEELSGWLSPVAVLNKGLHIYLCPVPCLVFHIAVWPQKRGFTTTFEPKNYSDLLNSWIATVNEDAEGRKT